MTSFSTNATLFLEDVSEPMDEETTTIFEQVLTGQLIDASMENNDQDHQVIISSVEVIEQNIIEINNSSERRLATTVLEIIIKVVGEVEPEATASYIANVTVAIQDELEEEESHQELTRRLAKESSFFDSYYSQQNELVVAEAQKGMEEENSEPPYYVLIVGGCVAVAVLVGSMFYMEQRSINTRGRRVARQDGFQFYDSSAIDGTMVDEEMQAVADKDRAKPSVETPITVQESRMKSVLDLDDEKVRFA